MTSGYVSQPGIKAPMLPNQINQSKTYTQPAGSEAFDDNSMLDAQIERAYPLKVIDGCPTTQVWNRQFTPQDEMACHARMTACKCLNGRPWTN